MIRPSNPAVVCLSDRPDGIRTWTKCEYHLLEWLTSGPFLAAWCQICQQGRSGAYSPTALRKALTNLRNKGWCQRFSIHTLSPRQPKNPYLVCQPGEPCPNFQELKGKLKLLGSQALRWQTLRVYLPSRQASNLFGRPYFGIGTPEAHAYRIAITQVVSVSRVNFPADGQEWIWDTHPGFRPYEQPLGIRVQEKGHPPYAVGLLAEQSSKALARLHAHGSQRGWPVELW